MRLLHLDASESYQISGVLARKLSNEFDRFS